MFLYLLPIFCAFFLHRFAPTNQKLLLLFCSIMAFFLCFGYMCGSDWRSYEVMYENIEQSWETYLLLYEPVFLLYTFVCKYIGMGYWGYTIISKLIVYVLIISLMYKYLFYKKDFYLAYIIFLSTSGYYLFIDCPFRNLIAIGIVLQAFPYLFQRRIGPYLFWVLFACSFHSSLIIFIPLYYLVKIRMGTWGYTMIYLFFFMVLMDKSIIMKLADWLFSWQPLIAHRIESYSEKSSVSVGSIFSVGMILQLIYLFFFLRIRPFFVQLSDKAYGIFNMTFFYFIFYRMALVIPVFVRFQYDINIFYCISIPVLLYNFKKESKIIFESCVVLAACMLVYAGVTVDTKYVPYTNYLYYSLTGKDLDFNTRDTYNAINSPYGKK